MKISLPSGELEVERDRALVAVQVLEVRARRAGRPCSRSGPRPAATRS